MYQLYDFLFTIFHLVIIGFNLLGWIWPPTRKMHFVLVLLTAGSWLVLGIWYGLGYCPVTDWQWQVKTHLGENNLPNSFIKYYADKLSGQDISADFIDAATSIGFAIAAILSVYFNFVRKKGKDK
ncbi:MULTISPECIES: DUF2784 domain-containing protein [Pedobacter]|uniref:DUF2784 domain-containing protein n=1 Tax=Pedobacter heparinus (strain ATCC 13125 / DSM 2366 / CIP 104194 / JCM 7457 / NBRC 12017 / NCIMB 9290 / NRRL B-14731 / HIM 762-3) TaxID=485917 RepID=C6XZE1_PEDHD|nr:MULTISPECIES: DUF2784 domain-containing protein [Pedobacter]ACU04637.1 conserved hypothetical protein [Pedobacter heparinus DSM 2366]MBB5437512.1 hypothetical protein [Pedobacter sp. AK017]